MSKKPLVRAKNASTKHPASNWMIVASTTVGALIVAGLIAGRRKS